MRIWVDLHIHSCLSGCAEDDMTPNNIVNMALIKGLDVIAVTDHNSARNIEAVMQVGKREGLLVVPGMELCTAEEIHLVCLFPSFESTLSFQNYVYKSLNPIDNREDIFGAQILMDSYDNEIGRERRMLSGACKLDVETAIMSVKELGGVVIPAHVNRQSYSMLNTLGAIPTDYDFKYLECSKNCNLDLFLQEHEELKGYEFIKSSDAHFLSDISEQEIFFDIKEKSIDSILSLLRQETHIGY